MLTATNGLCMPLYSNRSYTVQYNQVFWPSLLIGLALAKALSHHLGANRESTLLLMP